MKFIKDDVVAYKNRAYRVLEAKKNSIKLYSLDGDFWCNDLKNVRMLTKKMNINVTVIPSCISATRESQYIMQTVNAYLYHGLEKNMEVIYEDNRNVEIYFYR